MFLVMLLNSKVNYTHWENRGVKWEETLGWDLYLNVGTAVSCWSCLDHKG